MTTYSSKELKTTIERMVTKFRLWTIGITQRPNSRKKEHDYPKHWHMWRTNSLLAAQNTESYFLKKGMQGGTGGDLDDGHITYVYIF